jgi:CRP-like cAMP-binding protein
MAERKKRALEPSYQSGNRLLAALPALEYTRISRYLTTVMLDPRQEIARPNEPIEFVYFPIDSVTSIIALTSDGGSIEVATIGNEGMAGLPVFLGAESSPGYAFTQIAGSTERMNADDFRRESRDCESLRNLLKRYTQGFLTHISQATFATSFIRPNRGSPVGFSRSTIECESGSFRSRTNSLVKCWASGGRR